jgi:hypothetical protein
MPNAPNTRSSLLALLLLLFMAILAGGAALRESVTFDEIAHIAAGVSYLQKLDLRLNEEHPPLPKILAALPLVARGAHADYSHISWTFSDEFIPAYFAQWSFGAWYLDKWNDPAPTLMYARLPMLLLTLVLGWAIFFYAWRLGGNWAGLLCLAVYVSSTTFLTFGPLVHTDIAVTLFSLLTLWRFAELWRSPARKNILIFALCFAGALLSKFTAGILLFVLPVFLLSVRWRAVPGQPADKVEAKNWRRFRWRATLRGILYASLFVYLFYFIFSLRQSTGALSLLGHGPFTEPFRRLLLPMWLYLRAVLFVIFTSSRPTFILGHAYTHGVWFYFPVIFTLKSSFGFLGLLLLALLLGIAQRQKSRDLPTTPDAIPEPFAIHWRVLWVSLIVFTAFCLMSRLNFSIRHFSIPTVLLILLLAALPNRIRFLHQSSPGASKLAAAVTVALAASSLFTAIRSYPFYMPYLNPLTFGRPGYSLVNDSNLDWNQALPEVKIFATRHNLQKIAIDQYGINDPAVIVPGASIWDCQKPTAADEGQWVVVSAGLIEDGHNCVWLLRYQHESLAGGGMIAFHLPESIPEPGTPAGPPLPSAYRNFAGGPFDVRAVFADIIRHPETLPKVMQEMQARYQAARDAAKSAHSKGN